MNKYFSRIIICTIVLLTGTLCNAQTNTIEKDSLFPFVVPWENPENDNLNLSSWLDKPAGKFGNIDVGSDGHLYAGDKRIRFLGVNLCSSSCYPTKENAEILAKTLAKNGINLVRLHHMDYTWGEPNLIDYAKGNSRNLNAEMLDRMDYLVYQLKNNGIYVDINLLCSRSFKSSDGLPEAIDNIGWKEGHILGFFHKPALNLHKEFARKLLTHKNPYTGLKYTEDPCVLFVEINNENSLVRAWLSGQIDRMPEVLLKDLQKDWNSWLRNKYWRTDRLSQAWKLKEEPIGKELLSNLDSSDNLDNWVLKQTAEAKATAEISDDVPDELKGNKSVCIKIIEPTKVGLVEFYQPGLKIQAGKIYTLNFWAKNDNEINKVDIDVIVRQSEAPEKPLGLFRWRMPIKTQWQKFSFVFQATDNDDNAQLLLGDLADETGTYWFSNISLCPGGSLTLKEEERIEDATIPIISKLGPRAYTQEVYSEWMNFIWEKEDQYWQAMDTYLKRDLRLKSLTLGTVIRYSTPNLMARFKCSDTHTYWQHPQFTTGSWSAEDWIIGNETMVNSKGGRLPDLALRRLLGKPHCVTEYNHPAPNTYSSEAFLLLSAYASLQDWDVLCVFDYATNDLEWGINRIPNFFDIHSHPTKMATLIPSAAMFVREDIQPAKEQIVVKLDKEKEMEILTGNSSWDMGYAGNVGVSPEATLVHRIALATEGQEIPKNTISQDEFKIEGPTFISDTGELIWDISDTEKGIVTINSYKSKAIIGFGGGKQFNLGNDIAIKLGNTIQDGWCTLSLTLLEGKWNSSSRILITATGYTENTNMGWKDLPGYPPMSSSCGNNWGEAPSLVEGISAKLALPIPAERIKVWSLDERGNHKEILPVEKDDNGNAVINIGPQFKTLWYEAIVK